MSEGVDLGYLGSHVAEKIREMIFSGELLPKARIGQQSTARLLGIRRIPVREALRQLESEGLVVILPNSGARVASLDLDECIDTYKLRERLEPLALGESIPHLTPVQIEDIVNRAESLRAR
jgi:DNA-binding GntR family transcriptional regulator